MIRHLQFDKAAKERGFRPIKVHTPQCHLGQSRDIAGEEYEVLLSVFCGTKMFVVDVFLVEV